VEFAKKYTLPEIKEGVFPIVEGLHCGQHVVGVQKILKLIMGCFAKLHILG
jgi:hypothetical protein